MSDLNKKKLPGKVKLVSGGLRDYRDPEAGLSLDPMSPEGEPTAWSVRLVTCLNSGYLEVVEGPAVETDVDTETEIPSGAVYRDPEGRFTDDLDEDADGEPEYFDREGGGDSGEPSRKLAEAQCEALTAKGNRCKNKCVKGSVYCIKHQDYKPKEG